MTQRKLPKDPVKEAIVYLVALDTISFVLGVALILAFRQTWVIGLGVILMGSLAGGVLFLLKLVNVHCPDCRGSLRRDAMKGCYVCSRCGTEWGSGLVEPGSASAE